MAAEKVHVAAAVAVVLAAGLAAGVFLSLRSAQRTAGEPAHRPVPAVTERQEAGGESPDAGDWLPQAGQTPEAAIRAYYYYKDRGLLSKMRPLVAKDSARLVAGEDGGAMSDRAQALRGIAVDHVDAGETEATVYFRSWFSLGTKARGGRPYVVRLLKEDGAWKVSVPTSLDLTVGIEKGKDDYGFYDGTPEWWK